MNPASTLNTAAPYGWACVVSGVTWAEYKLSGAGKLTAEITRGPLILWATDTGEGEGLPTLHAPTLSALEARAAKINTRAAFDRLFWAARGKVRASVRWKTGRKTRQLRIYYALSYIKRLSFDISHRNSGLRGLKFWQEDETPKGRRKARRSIAQWHFEERLRSIAPIWMDMDNPSGIDSYLIEFWEMRTAFFLGRNVSPCRLMHSLPQGDEVAGQLSYLALKKDWIGFRASFRALVRPRLTLTALLKYLEAAAYRAHLAKRVKPVTRRSRAPRPLYARPRPPTAPTAPPLLEA